MTNYDEATSARLSKEMDEPAWLAEWRAGAAARFAALPWPDMSREEWRHTDLRPLDIERFSPDIPSPWSVDAPPSGVRVVPMLAASGADEELARAYLGRAGFGDFEEKLVSFNAAFGITLMIVIEPGVTLEQPVVATYGIGPGAALLPRTVVVAGEGAEATVIHRYGGDGGDALAVPIVELYAEQGARLNYLSVQDWSQDVWHLGVLRAQAGRDATVRTLAATLGGKLSRTVAEALLDGQGAHAEMLGIYFGDHDQHIDNRTLQAHRAPYTSSNLYYKGALKGRSRAVYSGLVDIEKDGASADAQQANRNLLLSDGASADPSPFLEIKTSEVVRATHGVSVGRPEADVLFYLQSRGLDPETAVNVYVKGFFQEIIDRVRVPDVRTALEDAVEAELALEDDE